MCNASAITFIGKTCIQGIYLLHITVAIPITVTFGRFQDGRPIPISPGDYLYIGSALGQRGSTSLAGRLLRHTTRSGSLPPHAIQMPLAAQLQKVGLFTDNKRKVAPTKRCFWHIDYLVDHLAAEITQIIALHTPHRLEAHIARSIAVDPAVTPVAPGLGASDDPRATHLLRVAAAPTWWQQLSQSLCDLATNNHREERNEQTTPHPCQ